MGIAISGLPPANPILTGAEFTVIVQDGQTRKIDILSLITGGIGDSSRYMFKDFADNKYNAQATNIKNVKAGEADNDAVNLAQLTAVANAGGSIYITNETTVINNPVGGNSINVQDGTNYTLTPLDVGGSIYMTSSSANNVIVPEEDVDSIVPRKAQWLICQRGTGVTRIVPANPNVVIRKPSTADYECAEQNEFLFLEKFDRNEYVLGGGMKRSVTPIPPPVTDPPPEAVPVIRVPSGLYKSTKGIYFASNGDCYLVNMANTVVPLDDWFSVGTPVASNYEIYCTKTAGDMENGQSDARDTWLPLTSTHVWTAEDSTSQKWMTLSITIREISTGKTANNTITINRKP